MDHVLGLAHELRDTGSYRTASTVRQDMAVNGLGVLQVGSKPEPSKQTVSSTTSPAQAVAQPRQWSWEGIRCG